MTSSYRINNSNYLPQLFPFTYNYNIQTWIIIFAEYINV